MFQVMLYCCFLATALALNPSKLYDGTFETLSSYGLTTPYSDATGRAKMMVGATGIETYIEIDEADMADKTFKAHLHAAPCSAGGGGHYQNPDMPGVVDAIEENWPELVCDASGQCVGSASNNWTPTESDLANGLSIVVHDTPSAQAGSGSKMLCVDLVQERKYSGVFSVLSGYGGGAVYSSSFEGSAELYVGIQSIRTRVAVSSTDGADEYFAAHLHAAPCSSGGGGHYQNPDNQGVVDDVEENWPAVTCNSQGECGGQASNTWVPTEADLANGLSIVVHDTPSAQSGSGEKMLCADLLPPRLYSGSVEKLKGYKAPKSYGKMSGKGEMRVGVNHVETVIRVSGGDGMNNQVFNAHLHAAPCSSGGGGHYQNPNNPGVVNAVDENWPRLVCDGSGMCTGSAWSNWAPTESDLDGLSIVVHDTPSAQSGSGEKMLCVDLKQKKIKQKKGKKAKNAKNAKNAKRGKRGFLSFSSVTNSDNHVYFGVAGALALAVGVSFFAVRRSRSKSRQGFTQVPNDDAHV